MAAARVVFFTSRPVAVVAVAALLAGCGGGQPAAGPGKAGAPPPPVGVLTVRMEALEDLTVLLDGTVNRALVPLKAVPKARRPPPATPKPEVAPQPIATPVLPKSDLRNPFAD